MNTPSAPSAASAENPWLRAFLAEPWDETIFGLIVIRRKSAGFELRHHKDFLATDLKPIHLSDLRGLVNFNAIGKYRPLKSSPDLVSGWVLLLQNETDFAQAIQTIHPNGLADRYAHRNGNGPVTSFRNFASRQSGMYRVTTSLAKRDVAEVIDSLCKAQCIKYRFWSIDRSGPTTGQISWVLPCLEPCAIFLEAARKKAKALEGPEKSA